MEVNNGRRFGGQRPYALFALAVLAVLAFAMFAAGCGTNKKTGGFSGSRYMSLNGCSETLTVRADGTYSQHIANKAGRSTDNTNKWTYGEGIKGSNEPGPWLVLQGKISPSEWCAAKPNTVVEHSDSLISGIGFNGAQELAQAPAKDTFWGIDMTNEDTFKSSPTVIFLWVLLTAIWIFALVDSARQRKFIWLVIIALTGCCGTVCYFIFGMWASSPMNRMPPGVPRGTPPGYG